MNCRRIYLQILTILSSSLFIVTFGVLSGTRINPTEGGFTLFLSMVGLVGLLGLGVYGINRFFTIIDRILTARALSRGEKFEREAQERFARQSLEKSIRYLPHAIEAFGEEIRKLRTKVEEGANSNKQMQYAMESLGDAVTDCLEKLADTLNKKKTK